MKIYTENEIKEVVRKAYMRGFEDGRLPRDRMPEPEVPSLEELDVKHTNTGAVRTLPG